MRYVRENRTVTLPQVFENVSAGYYQTVQEQSVDSYIEMHIRVAVH